MMVFTVFAVWLVYRTLLATRETLEDTRRIGQAQTRAYLHFKSTVITEDPETGGLRASLECVNTGLSSARQIRRCVRQGVGADMPDHELFMDWDGFEAMSDMGPGASNTYHFGIDGNLVSRINEGSDPDSKHIKWVGIVYYRDIFDREHHTAFAFKTNPGEKIRPRNLHISPHGNYST